MTVTHGICNSFRLERYQGVHVFGTDVLKLALYGAASNIGPDTTQYTSSGESSGFGYTAGGLTLSLASTYPKLNTAAEGGLAIGSVVLVDFDNLTFHGVVLSAVRAALIYNSSKSNKAIAVLDFGSEQNINGEDFTLIFPTPGATTAIIRSR